MQYNLATDLDQERFVNRANALLQKGVVVELTEKTFRSPNQNRYLHLLIGVVAMDTGVGLEYAKREYFKKLVNKDLFVIKRSDRFAGEIEDLRSSADLTIEEMSMAIDRFKRWGAENGFYMPNPEDTALLKEIEIEMGRLKMYL
jgi:hypothetical protein